MIVELNLKEEINSFAVENIVFDKPMSWVNTIKSIQSSRNTGGRKFRSYEAQRTVSHKWEFAKRN